MKKVIWLVGLAALLLALESCGDKITNPVSYVTSVTEVIDTFQNVYYFNFSIKSHLIVVDSADSSRLGIWSDTACAVKFTDNTLMDSTKFVLSVMSGNCFVRKDSIYVSRPRDMLATTNTLIFTRIRNLAKSVRQ